MSIAIVGMAGVFPRARDIRQYWTNIVNKVDAVGDPPPDWEAELYLDPSDTTGERPYCVRGGYLGELAAFDPSDFGVMPNSVDGTEPDHFLALKAAYAALDDAGYLQREGSRERAEVIVGRGTYVNRGNTTVVQHAVMVDQFIRVLGQLHPEHTRDDLNAIRRELKKSLPPFHAETAAGLVPNIITGRIANRLNCMGANFIVDAACASSLVAVDLGMRDLQANRCDVAIVGGVHASTPPPIVTIFCQLNAISRRGEIRPFDERADGTLLGEGVGMIVLKRLADAERDGDRVYAVLKGIGSASDGRALGLLAPRLEGEELALRRAYEQAGVEPSTVGLIEAHGTATSVGDAVEVEALTRVFGDSGTAQRCALGSVKSMISHLMPASGIAGLIKTTLALHHRVLPPTINCEQPNPKLGLEQSRFYLNTEARPWIHGGDAPRRAGVNAFGFGGINAHAVLEEYAGPAPAPARCDRDWDSELVVIAGTDRADVIARAERLRAVMAARPEAALRDLAWTLNREAFDRPERLAIVATSTSDLEAKLSRAVERLRGAAQRIRQPDGIYYFARPLGHEGKLAFIFPGEGSQYPNMLADLAIHFADVRTAFDLMDRAFADHPRGYLPSDAIFPKAPAGEGRDGGRLFDMDTGAEAVFTANQALAALMRTLHIDAQAMVGHSTGEHSALLAAGAVHVRDNAQLIGHVRDVNGIFEQLSANDAIPGGQLLAVGGVALDALESIVAESGGAVHIAMDNCPHQVVLCGSESGIVGVSAALTAHRAICQTLPFARAYHTPLFEVFCAPMREYFARVDIRPPDRVTLYSCTTAAPVGSDADAIRDLVSMQWARRVRFRETIERMHDDGVRLFVEVGPRGNLIAFVDDVLRGRDYAAIAANVQHRSGIAQMHHLLAQLVAHGVTARLEALYEQRAPAVIDVDAAPVPVRRRPEMKLSTGLQPMRLPASFTRPVRTATPAPPAPPPSVAADAASRARVVQEHLQTMERFLAVQGEVLQAYMNARQGGSAAVGPAAVGPAKAGPYVPAVDVPAVAGPLAGTILSLTPGRQVTTRRTFDAEGDRFFTDHTLGRNVSLHDPSLTGLPVLPLTFTMEALAEAGAVLRPGLVLTRMEHVRAYRWITLERGATTVEIAASAADSTSAVEVALREVDGAGEASGPVLAEARLVFADAYPVQPQPLAIGGLQSSSWRTDDLYTEGMFHGPAFRAVTSIDGFSPEGTVATMVTPPRDQLFASLAPSFITDAVVLDAAGQVLAFWAKERLGRFVDVFPFRLGALDLYAPPSAPRASSQCRVRAELAGDAGTRCDIDVVDQRGVVARLSSWEDRRFELPTSILRLRVHAAKGWVSSEWAEPIAGRAASAVACRRIDDLPPELFESSGGIWLQMLAGLTLGRRERALWKELTGATRRRAEWLLGRVAAKDAVRQLMAAHRGLELCPADVEILPDEHGRPRVAGAWVTRGSECPVVSVTHTDGVAAALAALDSRTLVGIDVERVSTRREGFDTIAFTAPEQALIASVPSGDRLEWHLRLWCAKEAVGKAFGRGFSEGLHSVRVTEARLDDGAVTLEVVDGLRTAFPDFTGRALRTRTFRHGDYVSSALVCER